MAGELLDHLQSQGYEPQDTEGRDLWADLVVSGTGTLRVIVHPDDGHSVDVYMFSAAMATEWGAHLSPGTPDLVILALIEAAEWQLAGKRGGPVTPKQRGSAS
jgi:hypothetical protein